MRNVQTIIDTFGGLEALKHRPIRLTVPGFMRLVIEYIGKGPRDLDMISVAHYGEQNGDPMRDPEIMFEICPDSKGSLAFHPVAIQQDYIGSYREAVWHDEKGRIMIHPAHVRDIATFARIWDRNLKAQGFIDAAKRARARQHRCERASALQSPGIHSTRMPGYFDACLFWWSEIPAVDRVGVVRRPFKH
jgi:hypothetical protein